MELIGVDICPKPTAGLCNQLYSIIAMCRLIYFQKKKFVFIGRFLKSINTNNYCNISDIIDIQKTNVFLNKYNLVLIDVHNCEYNIDMNNIKLIPNFSYEQDAMFIDLLQNIIFKKEFINKANQFMISNYYYTKLGELENSNKPINCIHLRLEDDAINCWSSEINLSPDIFKQIAEDKYIELIKKHFNKNDIILLLSSNYNNKVVKFLNENNYNYIITKKFYEERELSAIVDLHISTYCNNKYIFIFESSFSFSILRRLKQVKMGIMITYNKIFLSLIHI